jgi:hypothetical protein
MSMAFIAGAVFVIACVSIADALLRLVYWSE